MREADSEFMSFEDAREIAREEFAHEISVLKHEVNHQKWISEQRRERIIQLEQQLYEARAQSAINKNAADALADDVTTVAMRAAALEREIQMVREEGNVKS